MSRPYQFGDKEDRVTSPLDRRAAAPYAQGQAPSFKTNVNRAKTKKWVEAKAPSYGGDDWDDYDEEDEYGVEAARDGPLPPLPGQNPGRSFTQPISPAVRGDRRNSFDTGDERRAFSSGFPQANRSPHQLVVRKPLSGAGEAFGNSPVLGERSMGSALPFIRPADIYQRMKEEEAKRHLEEDRIRHARMESNRLERNLKADMEKRMRELKNMQQDDDVVLSSDYTLPVPASGTEAARAWIGSKIQQLRRTTMSISGDGSLRKRDSATFSMDSPQNSSRTQSDTSTAQPLKLLIPQHSDSTSTRSSKILSSSNEKSLHEIKVDSSVQSAASISKECGLEPGHHDYELSSLVPIQYVSSLGHGSLGVVEEVRMTGTDRPTFVRKKIRVHQYGPQKQQLRLIRQEVDSLRRLSHAHIVTIIGTYQEIASLSMSFYSLLMSPVGEADLSVFLHRIGDIVIALRTATSFQAISGMRMEESQAARESLSRIRSQEMQWLKQWFRCLASALAFMHSQGVRHQDIKPSNIIHRGADVYFTDFSSSAEFDVGQATSTENPAATTMMYRAPEVESGAMGDEVSFRRHGRGTDVFSLGCVFVEMLVVLCEYSLADFHTACIRPRGSYAKALEQMDIWFLNRPEWPYPLYYEESFKPLLAFDRGSRPSAEEVFNHFESHSLGRPEFLEARCKGRH